MGEVKPLYLTCTASQAQEFNTTSPHGIYSLNELLEVRAISHSNVCIAGFPEQPLGTPRWTLLEFTYSSLLMASNEVAIHYEENTSLRRRSPGENQDRIIALLSLSCADLLVTLFAALRLGYGVLLLAPQNTDEAIAHLCRVTSTNHLICHESLLQRGRKALQLSRSDFIVEMAPRHVWYGGHSTKSLIKMALSPLEETNLTALIMHTSGSTGMPKPIYHPHRIWTDAIPCMPWKPAFTTTPLFHGGSADLLRSMNALSILYLFSSTHSMTAASIIGAVSACPNNAAFLSVPYILKMLAEDTEGLKMLQRMDLVSVGGAPLPEQLGDEMVQQGIKLVSRLGSSECGFLMSSHRNYDLDLEWSWLRTNGLGLKMLHFELADDSESENTFELVVDKDWSTRVVSNRDDGSFATGDLYAKHPSIPNAWRYCGRSDDIIVMMNGKKASANAIETKLRASRDIAEAITFGSSRPMLGVLVVPASLSTPKERLIQRIHEVNASSASYATIIDDMIICLPYGAKLPKTSKGLIIRQQALKQFTDLIENAYRCLEQGDSEVIYSNLVSDEDVRNYVRAMVSDASKKHANGAGSSDFGDDADFFALGLTSLHAVQIRGSLQKIVANTGQILGNNIVFEYPSVRKLSQHLSEIRAGRCLERQSEEHQHTLMRDLLNRYGNFDNIAAPPDLVVTGATGALGAHIIAELVLKTRLHIVALVRAADDEDATRRLLENFEERKLDGINQTRYRAIAATLSEDRLGLSEAIHEKLLTETELVIHAAWPVNFAYTLESFFISIDGFPTDTRVLLDFTASTLRRAKMIFCSSIATVSNDPASIVEECIPHLEASAVPMGYAQSKWIAEHMCDRAYRSSALAGRVSIARIGQLCGDTEHGIWNEKEGWPLMIATSRYIGCLPALEENISWLPLDVAAKIIVNLASHSIQNDEVALEVPVYHVLQSATVPWGTLLEYFGQSGLAFERVPPNVWVNRLCAIQDTMDSSFRNLQTLWEGKVCHILYSRLPSLCDAHG
ncbi:acetyl-CoA synthetase-like protein [Irpex rosettiformis]|uniref:Acetyl-CoA synthetase-like protein n=1 Tax=Irpex rosettiformis TaxID=378272 RepID=A0ACB8TQ67_9APHY|nr:acetyl-CoA synthetase-like protein [Irpex rosettiformis]